MADIQGLKEKVQREIDEIAPLLIECSDWMADNPEIGSTAQRLRQCSHGRFEHR